MTGFFELGSAPVTAAAVVVAAVTTGVAWRAVRTARRQAEDRITALRAAIHGDVPAPMVTPDDQDTPSRLPAPIAIRLATGGGLALLVGAIFWGGVGPAAPAPDRQPLELATLRHDVSASAFTVSGELAVPAGRVAEGLAVELVTLDREGHAIASGGAPVSLEIAAPHERVPFTVSVPWSSPVDHYTIRFRDSSGLQPHVDRRRLAGTAP